MRITKWWPIFPIRINIEEPQLECEIAYGSKEAECERCYHVDDATLNILTEKQSWKQNKTGPCQSARCFPVWKQSIRQWWCQEMRQTTRTSTSDIGGK